MNDPALVNSAPFEGGWLFKVRVSGRAGATCSPPTSTPPSHRLSTRLPDRHRPRTLPGLAQDPPALTPQERLMSLLNSSLHELDPDVAAAVDAELHRQQSTLEMIASENFAPVAVMEAQGSVLTNKYAEGYPGRRYYGGCEHVDVVEQIAIDRIKALFGAEAANVQPHSGAQANAAAMFALLKPGDTILGLNLAHGGHLTHGMKINFSGKLYNVVPYHVDEKTGLVDMDEVERLAKEHRPKLIIAGWSAYPRQLDFAAFRRIADEVGALPDGRHGALRRPGRRGAAPLPGAARPRRHHHHAQDPRRSARRRDPVHRRSSPRRSTPRSSPVSRAARWSTSSRPRRCPSRSRRRDEFKERQQRTLDGAQHPRRAAHPGRRRPRSGVSVLSGGTDVHLVLVDLRNSELDGQQAEDRLHEVGITVNRNAIPNDPRPPMVTSGLRIGTPALATRGFQAEDFREVADIIAEALQAGLRRRGPQGPRHRARGQAPAVPDAWRK